MLGEGFLGSGRWFWVLDEVFFGSGRWFWVLDEVFFVLEGEFGGEGRNL